MCMWFGYYSLIILSLFSQTELSHFSGVITIKVNRKLVPCVRNSVHSFETPQVFWSCSEDVHVAWIYSPDYFLLECLAS